MEPSESKKLESVIFDLYATLAQFGVQHQHQHQHQHHPYRRVLQWAREQGRRPKPDDARILMTIDDSPLDQAAERLGRSRSDFMLDAACRTLQAGEIAGVSALLVHALSEEAARFYLSRGFVQSPIQPMTLCLRLADVRAGLGNP